MILWRGSFQPVHTQEPEEPSTGMFYSKLCNGIPNFVFHIRALSKGRGEKKADIEALGHSSAVAKRKKQWWHFCCLFATVQLQTILHYEDMMKLECFSRDNRQSRDTREEGEQLRDAVTVFPHVLRSSGGTVSAWFSWTFLISCYPYKRHCLELSIYNPQSTREPCYRLTEFENLLQFVLMSQ